MNLDYVFLVLKQEDGRIAEVAAIRTGPDGKEKAAYASKTRILEKDAFRGVIDGMRTELVTGLGEQYVVVSFYAEEIDRPTLRRECNERSIKLDPFHGRAWISLSQLSWPLVFSDLIRERSLRELARYYGIEYQANGAEEEVVTLMRVYGKLMRRYRTALVSEAAVTEAAGPTLEGLRSYFGF